MQQRIVLPKEVRTFIGTGYSQNLRKSGSRIPSGTSVEIGSPCTKTYNDREQLVVPVRFGKKEHFIIVSEIGNLNSYARK